ncbi:hypothetical protein JL720_2492 [Aureococcus anophagefferens]|nr:hypothetical protein JL720_2492 [Aureococcus anophagefferens]
MVREPPSDGPDEAVGPSAVSPYCVDFNKIPALEPYQLVCYAGPIFSPGAEGEGDAAKDAPAPPPKSPHRRHKKHRRGSRRHRAAPQEKAAHRRVLRRTRERRAPAREPPPPRPRRSFLARARAASRDLHDRLASRARRKPPTRAWLAAEACFPVRVEGTAARFEALCAELFATGDLDCRDDRGRTLLWIAVDKGDADAAKILVTYQRSHGYLNLSQRDDRKKLTPLALAERNARFSPEVLAAFRPPPADAEARAAELREIARMETKIDQAPRRRVSAFFGVNRDEFGAKRKRDDKSRLSLARLATKVRSIAAFSSRAPKRDAPPDPADDAAEEEPRA